MSDSGFGTLGDNFDALSADEDDLSVEDGQIGGFTPFAPMWPNGWPFSVEEVNKIRSDMCKAAVGWLPEAEPVPDWKCLEIAEEVDQALLDMWHNVRAQALQMEGRGLVDPVRGLRPKNMAGFAKPPKLQDVETSPPLPHA